ncbi:MAG: prephenate dehydrogenase/arogenate dehydrogenase family protein [Acidobacteriota bacterium]
MSPGEVSHWKVVTVAGVGLIGGSFALALRQAGFPGRIIGVSSPSTIRAAIDRGAIDEALPLAEAAAQSDVIYLAQPIERILETLSVIDDAVRPGTLITDAGSTKQAIVERAARTIRRGSFVGGHPMAGKETRGIEAADANLFRSRPYVLTGSDAVLEQWVEKIGARVVRLGAAEHDRLVALVSHLPQLLSTTLASLIADSPEAARVAGPAAADLTRLALSPYEIWRDIFSTNSWEIDRVIGDAIARLELLRGDLLSQSDMQATFARAAQAASRLRET